MHAMPTITIRDVPPTTRDVLASRAARSGRSLQEYLKANLVLLAERPDPEDVVASIRERKKLFKTEVSIETILEQRDAERR